MVSVVEQTDSLNTILAMATTLVGDIDTLVKQINIALEGRENTPLTRTITQINEILENINEITSDAKGKLLIFAVPNNDGCGFILYQLAKFEDSGSMQYYLTGEDMLYYEKIENFKSIFDGCNCK